MSQVVRASAPSNIALIKYMGKKSSKFGNEPVNSSLSWTLPHLVSEVELTPIPGNRDEWRSLTSETRLSERGIQRFLDHFQFLKTQFKSRQAFQVRSGNHFPSDCGLASSASSFAALTRAACLALGNDEVPVNVQADWSRKGSGSSCRSFFSDWVIWNSESVQTLEKGFLRHLAVIVESERKTVSSSEAHRRVITSSLFEGRAKRAEDRFQEACNLIKEGIESKERWRRLFELTWQDFWDMHSLFHTSDPPFGYMTSDSMRVIERVMTSTWNKVGLGPLITMDAGANVHLLFQQSPIGCEQADILARFLGAEYLVFDSQKVV